MRDLIASAEEAGDLYLAWVVSNDLAGLLWITGRSEAALSMAEQMADLTRRAGLEPWAQSANTRLRNEGRRLQFLATLGRHAEVLHAVETLLPRIAALPDPDWDLREAVLNAGYEAAVGLTQWLAALDFNAEILESRRRRGAPPLEQARVRFNDHAPLLRLGRSGEARVLLHNCRIVFERENDVTMLGKVLSALADLEETADPTAALRYNYVAADLDDIMIGHLRLATYISKTQGSPREVLAHHLAAVFLDGVMGSRKIGVHHLVDDLAALGSQARAHFPADFAALCATVEAVEGVRFGEVFDRLVTSLGYGAGLPDALLQEVLAGALKWSAKARSDRARHQSRVAASHGIGVANRSRDGRRSTSGSAASALKRLGTPV